MIVFCFLQEDSRTGENYLVTNVFENYQDLYDRWLDNYMSWDLCEYDYDKDDWVPVLDEERMKDILKNSRTDEHYLAHNKQVFYTFQTINTEWYDQEYFQEQRDMVVKINRRNRI